MISKLFRWLSLAAGLAAFSLAPLAIAEAQDFGVADDEFYDFYEGGFDEEPDQDDWFYDHYSYDMGAGELETYANYDWDADQFEWEEDGLFG